MDNFAKTSCTENSEVIYSGYKMYQELKILRSPPQWEFCTKGKGDSNGRIEAGAGAAEKKSFAVDSYFLMITVQNLRLF